ncbi:MAG: DNA polymerase III subunit beta [Puniceicoccales bacterium]|jgi:DNA polymerase-3 subunit beta|nr:DNA polymerase III subunit beta [Puniceicoccales bacterium]
MKFTVDRKILCDGLQAVGSPVSAKPSMSILGNVLLEATGDELTLTATNLDLGICCSVAASVPGAGVTTLPVKKLASIARAIPAGELDFELCPTGKSMRISGGGSLFRLPCLPAADFPSLPTLEKARTLDFSAEQLFLALRHVEYAQSSDGHRQILNGICVQVGGGQFSLMATDGRRLAVDSIPCSGEEGSLILPSGTAAELLRLLPGAESVRFSFTGRQVAFTLSQSESAQSPGRIHAVSKVVEGNYPNCKQVIPGPAERRVRIGREMFLEALQRATLVSSGTGPSVRLKFSENLLEVFAASVEFGEAHERVAIIFPEPGETEISFNPRYLIEPLRALNCEEIAFEFRDPLSPGVLRAGDHFLCVVMPLRSGVV